MPSPTAATPPPAAVRSAEAIESLGIEPARLPRHIAIIMDGNGRWATAKGLTRSDGHREGAKTVRAVVTECARLGLDALTLYSFSTENWSRSPDEVNTLMGLYVEYLAAELPTMLDNNVRFRQIGRREGLPDEVLRRLDQATQATADNTGLTLVLAINYGARTEITDAVRALARQVRDGSLDPEAITADDIAAHLYTAGLPDPDLLIRTAGERRLSNYLLWQVSYAELCTVDACWPDFGVDELHAALRDFAARHRKFGKEQ
ncbi:MAG: isoprenyl transferase [Planctomycetota bacterium]